MTGYTEGSVNPSPPAGRSWSCVLAVFPPSDPRLSLSCRSILLPLNNGGDDAGPSIEPSRAPRVPVPPLKTRLLCPGHANQPQAGLKY